MTEETEETRKPIDTAEHKSAASAEPASAEPVPGDTNGDGVVDIDDKRLPLVTRIYGIILLVQGLLTIPMIVIAFTYAIRALIVGDAALDKAGLAALRPGDHALVPKRPRMAS